MKRFAILLAWCACGPTNEDDKPITRDSITPKCEAQVDERNKYTMRLDVQTVVTGRVMGVGEVVASCQVSQIPAQQPPGGVQLTFHFSGSLPERASVADLLGMMQDAMFRIDFPGREGIFVEQDILSSIVGTDYQGGILVGTAEFKIDHVTQYDNSSSDPSCVTDDLQGVCYRQIKEDHQMKLAFTFPVR